MRELVVHELIRHSLLSHADQEIVSGPVRLTYAAFYERVLRLADGLKKMGVGRGTVVGVLDVNTHRYLELHYALSMRGAVLHTINFRLPAEEMLYTVRHAGDEWLFVWEGFREIVEKVRNQFPNWVWLTDGPDSPSSGSPIYEGLVEEGEAVEDPSADEVSETDPFSIFYTTGTTGPPKGVCYRHRDMILASLQILHHLALHEGGARVSSRDVFMPLIPFFHIHGWGMPLFVPYLGAKLVLPGRSGPQEQVSLISQERVTCMNMVPTQLHMLLDASASSGARLDGLKILTGGSALPSGLARRASEAGLAYSLIYGGSDQLGTSISVVPERMAADGEEGRQELSRRMRTLPAVELEIRNETGAVLPRDGRSIGEIWVRSPWLPNGYYKDPERSQASYVGGWFRTGDLGVLDGEGFLTVLDRDRDAIKSGGEWIASTVVEGLLSEHPKVAMAAVIPVADERWGERPMGIIQAREPVGEEELREFLQSKAQEGRLARFWIPDRFVVVETLPLTSAGKLHKAALRKQFAG